MRRCPDRLNERLRDGHRRAGTPLRDVCRHAGLGHEGRSSEFGGCLLGSVGVPRRRGEPGGNLTFEGRRSSSAETSAVLTMKLSNSNNEVPRSPASNNFESKVF